MAFNLNIKAGAGAVILEFDQPIQQVAVPPSAARKIAYNLLINADEAEANQNKMILPASALSPS